MNRNSFRKNQIEMNKNNNNNNQSVQQMTHQNNNNNNNNMYLNQEGMGVDDDTLLDDFSYFANEDESKDQQYNKGSIQLDNIDPFMFLNNNETMDMNNNNNNNYTMDFKYRPDQNYYRQIPMSMHPMGASVMMPLYSQNLLNASNETVNSKNSGKSSSCRSVNSRGSDSSNSRGGDDWKKYDDDPRKKNDAEKKRQDRNSREQQRSFKISKQIDQLKALLDASGIKVKNSKYDILAGVAGYVKHLQSRSNEIQKDIRSMDQQITVKSANIIPQETTTATVTTTTTPAVISTNGTTNGTTTSNNNAITSIKVDPGLVSNHSSKYNVTDPFGVLPDRGFKQYFMQTSLPLALAASDGRLFECNQSFLDITGLQREHVLHASIFKLVDPTQLHEAYINIGTLLQNMSSVKNQIKPVESLADLNSTNGLSDNQSTKSTVHTVNVDSERNSPQNEILSNGNNSNNNSSNSSINGQESIDNQSVSTNSKTLKNNSKTQINQLPKRVRRTIDVANNSNSNNNLDMYTSTEILGLHSTKSFTVKSLIISAFDGKQLNLGIGVVLPESSKTICLNNIQQPLFSVALVPVDD